MTEYKFVECKLKCFTVRIVVLLNILSCPTTRHAGSTEERLIDPTHSRLWH
jgi:hypothetical protein